MSMFVFTITISLACLTLAAVLAVLACVAFKSDDGGGETWIGSLAGAAIGAVALVLGSVGVVGMVIVANRVWS